MSQLDFPAEIAARARQSAIAVINLGTVAANYSVLARASAPAECAAVVKGDGYGLGMLEIANTAWHAGARLYFVARFEDGIRVRSVLPHARICVLDGLSGYEPGSFEQARLIPMLSNPEDCRRWMSATRAAAYMLHIDTGMNRLGLKPRELSQIVPLLRASSSSLAAYLTHLASADDGDLELCRTQIAQFESALEGLPPAPRSISNSSGLFLGPDWRGAITRPGKALYGINPAQKGQPNPVCQALSVLAPILQVGDIAAGDTVGYSATFRAARQMRIATLGIGYANGYPRSLSNRGVAAFSGHRAPVVGRVSMDLVTVDVTDLPANAIGAGYAEMLGPTIGLTELAELADTNEYELQIALGAGCKRVYVGNLPGTAATV